MNFVDLMSLQSKASQLSIDSPVDDLVPLFKLLGVTDPNLVAQVQGVAMMVTANPGESVMSFLQSGGLVRLFAAANGEQSVDDGEPSVIRCPHCEEDIII